MSGIGYAVELEDGDPAMPGLVDRTLEIVQLPGRSSVTGRGNKQRMIQPRLIGESLPFPVRVLG